MTLKVIPAQSNGTSIATISVTGLKCAGCAANARAKLLAVAGVSTAAVDFASGVAKVSGCAFSGDALCNALRSAGFEATLQEVPAGADPIAALVELQRESANSQQSRQSDWGRRAIVAGCLWIGLETLHWSASHDAMHGWAAWILFAGSALALATAGLGFYASAWRALIHRTTNMDTLVALGVTAAFGLSSVNFFAQQFWSALHDQPLYFAEATALLAIISAGHWLEARSTRRASVEVGELLRLAPDTALRRTSGGATEEVSVANIVAGDLVQVRPGGRVPVDGVIVEGKSSFDESSLTGEPLAIGKGLGDQVASGTIAIDGAIVLQATASGSDSALGRIAKLVYEAQLSQAPIQRHADRVCRIFVPAVLMISFATLIGWLVVSTPSLAIINAVTVLVISCPCALGIATPLAMMVGIGHASKRGILVRTADALQVSSAVKKIVFDKTGTLTTGCPILDSHEVLADDLSQERVLALAASAEARSEHPMARAIIDAANTRGVQFPDATDFSVQPGMGVTAMVEGKKVVVCRDTTATARVEVDGRLVGRLSLSDQPRAEARAAIGQLRAMGLGVVMLSGDRTESARKTASQVGLVESEVLSDQTPQSKETAIDRMNPGSVMMVGDGINDAAALARAGVGVAMGSATALAASSADIILLRNDLHSVGELVQLSRSTMAVVKQNLTLAFAYNAVAIPLAALGFLGTNGPLIAAIAMGLSDISVVGNALRLRAKLARRPDIPGSGKPMPRSTSR